MTLDEQDIEAIAIRVAQIIDPQAPAVRLLSAAEVAAALGVSRAWVYQHAEELGGLRLDVSGRVGRSTLRFDLERVIAILAQTQSVEPSRVAPRQRAGASDPAVELIAYDGAA